MNKDREYMIGGTSQKVVMCSRAVIGLVSLNQPGRRENQEKDKIFIKALLLAVCTLETIKRLSEQEPIPKELLRFMREIFSMRIADDEDASRYLRFNDLVAISRQELKEGNFH